MVKKSYFYLGEQNIGIEAPKVLLKRIGRNFEEVPIENGFNVGDVKVEEGEMVEFSRDRSKPYLATKLNDSRGYHGVDFLRYGVLVRTIWQRNPPHYEVQNFLPLDETGALSCFKKIYYNTSSSKNKALIHGSLVCVGGKGILITGKCWSGKTSLTLGFLEKFLGDFVSDGNVLISYEDGHIVGHYLPRPVFVRFHSINSSKGLSGLLKKPYEAESIQPFDKEAIEEIIAGKKYELDAGLNISRRKFAELIGVKTTPTLKVDRVVHTKFGCTDLPTINPISVEASYGLLLAREFPKETTLGNLRHQKEIERPDDSIIERDWLDGVERVETSFDANKTLTKSLLEDLICSH